MADRSLDIKLGADAAPAIARMKEVRGDYDALKERIERSKPAIDLSDKLANIKFKELNLAMDRLGKRTARPSVDLAGAERMSLQIDKLDLKLDKLGHKAASIGGRGGIGGVFDSILGMFGAGAQGANTANSASGGGGLSGLLTKLGIGAAIMPFVPAGIGLGIGGAAGAAGLYGAYHYDKQQITPGLSQINSSMAEVFKSIAPSIGMIVAELGKFTKMQMPNLAKFFGASLPFISAFAKVGMQFAKAVLPAMTNAMKQFAPSLPIITSGLKILSVAIARFINDIGPGMRASAVIFKGAMTVIGGFLMLTGKLASVFADAIVRTGDIVRAIARGIPPFFDRMFHAIASAFDSWRHGWASIWDQVYSATIGTVIRLVTSVTSWFHKLPGNVSSAIASLPGLLFRAGAAALHALLSGLESAGSSVLGYVEHLASSIAGALSHIPVIGGAIGAVGRLIPHASGGLITEPIIGRGLRTGAIHTFGEGGLIEQVTPLGHSGSHGGGGGNVYFTVQGFVGSEDQLALKIQQMLRKRKQRAGNSVVGIA